MRTMLTLLAILFTGCFLQAESKTGTMEVVRTDVSTSVGSVYVPGTASQTTCNTSGTVTDTGTIWTNVNSTTNCTTNPGRQAQTVPVTEQSIEVRVIIDGQKLLLRPSGWRHWTLNPGFYQISYSLKNNTWKDISVYGNDTTSGKVMRLKYRVITEW